jgi:bacillolysin
MLKRLFLATALVAAAVVPGPAQTSLGMQRVRASDVTSLRQWDRRIDSMIDDGELRIRQTLADPDVAGRVHQRAAQFYKGIPVFGADLTRQLANGQTVSVFGVVYNGIDVDISPTLSAEEAARRIEQSVGERVHLREPAELVILPVQDGSYSLAWRLRVASRRDITVYFVDAHTGSIAEQYSDLQTQSAVGRGVGVLGDQKKVSTQPGGGGYYAIDRLRPPAIGTFDFKGDTARFFDVLEGTQPLFISDAANDSDNDWNDGATVDAHVYSGYTYDYFFKRHGRSGLNDRNLTITNMVHMVRRQDFATATHDTIDLYLNAAYLGGGYIFYGEGLPPGYVLLPYRQTVDFFSGALDIVAHELTHGVTDYTSHLIYQNESGALNEAFSDVMATGVEFMFQPPGNGLGQADYSLGEDVIRPGGTRSLANPGAFDQPDHYSNRYTGRVDNGGVHINSGIVNNAYYLAIEGGTNRTSGQPVTGVGSANREQIEKIFFRAFTVMLPANANFSTARAATIQAARDLYGGGSAAERAITQAWSAVGVN